MSIAGRDPDRKKHSERVVKLHLKQLPPAEIARKLDLPQAQVARELVLARKNWQEARVAELAEASQRQRDIDRLEQTFVRALVRRGLPGAQDADGSLADDGVDQRPAQPDTYVGNMEVASRLIRRHAQLRATQSPAASQSPTPDPIDDLSEEEVDRELARITHELELRGTKASS